MSSYSQSSQERKIEIVSSPLSYQDRKIIDDLAKNTWERNWEEVVQMYKKHGRLVHMAGLNEAGDTALRMAISADQTNFAKQLVDEAAKTHGALEKLNNGGLTVLHIAAFLGKDDICSHIAEKDRKLIGIRTNKDKETPLFYAVHFGKINAFLSLHHACGGNEDLGYVYGRRGDGETILHTAISRRYYELAYLIIKLYPNFVHAMNEKGFSPLYLMAATPSAFRSGCQIRGIHQLVYHLIHVSKLKIPADIEDEKEYHEKQQTCISSPWHRIKAFMGCSKNLQDEEGQHVGRTHCKGEKGSDMSKSGSQGPNKLVSIIGSRFKCVADAVSVIFGPGTYISPKKLKETKQNNVWSEQIMKELVKKIAKFRYEHNGKKPAGIDPVEEKWLEDNGPSDQNQQLTDEDTNGKKKLITIVNNEAKPDHVDIKFSDDQDKNFTVMIPYSKRLEKMMKDDETEAERREREELRSIKKRETPILVAARNGVKEIVEEVHKRFPIAIFDSDIDKKNVVLLAAENRTVKVFDYLKKQEKIKERIFGQADNDGNTALHLAAKLKDDAEPWSVPGPALQMQCEVKWYKFVRDSMDKHFFRWYNEKKENPEDLFKSSHTKMVSEGGVWLNKTSESFIIVATLIATVAFATSAIVPGGVSTKGNPNLENRPAFSTFAISSLVALCSSIICVMMFLAVLTSSYKDEDFGKDLPRKFLIGLTSMFVSITSMLISFCAGHSFVIKEELKYAASPVYAITCLVVTVVTIAQFPFYFDLVMITFSKKPRSNKTI